MNRLVDLDEDINSDEPPITEAEKEFAKNIFNWIQGIIDEEDRYMNEEFTSQNSLQNRFNKHCIGKTNNKSTHTKVLYDFTKLSQYENYEKKITPLIGGLGNILINSLYDVNTVIKGFHKFFEGGKIITFLSVCGFENNLGPVIISFKSYANDVTKNYNQNTVDCIILSLRAKTVTLYPLAADKVESKFNSFVQNYNVNKLPYFSINR